MYLDSAYIAKFSVNEPDATAVRKVLQQASSVCLSAWALLESSARAGGSFYRRGGAAS